MNRLTLAILNTFDEHPYIFMFLMAGLFFFIGLVIGDGLRHP